MLWQQIAVNKRNSIFLMATMAAVLLLLGYLLGMAFGGNPKAGPMGMMIAAGIWTFLVFLSFSSGDKIMLAASKAKKVTPDVHPMLFNIVEEMTIAASLPKMPDIYIINDPAPNAFATGRSPKSASVAVTAGLLSRLNRDELQGVIAHEISHIIHRDILFVTLAGVMLGTIVLVSQVFLRGMFYSSMMGGRRYSSRSRNDGGGAAIMMIIAIIAAILAPIFAQILYFSLSRRREYLADAGGARLTRYPEGLASALEKISGAHIKQESANKVTAPMYIEAPYTGKMALNAFSTHPPIQKRIEILRKMQHGASFKDYASASESVLGKSAGLIPKQQATKDESVTIREASREEKQRSRRKSHRELGDVMRKVNGFQFVNCTCGVRIKVPPTYTAKSLNCPRCGTAHQL